MPCRRPTRRFSIWRRAASFDNTLFDCELLDHAFTTSNLQWAMDQKQVIAGTKTYEYCTNNGTRYPNLRAASNCDSVGVPAAQAYNYTSNPQGARCTYQDNMVNVFGRDPKTGFARRPFDNVGVQYGVGAFNDGRISFEQFVDQYSASVSILPLVRLSPACF
jgi:Tannase-like family of unknown function (DUF6351)